MQINTNRKQLYSSYDWYGKPHPGIYLTSASKLGVAVTQCVALEDSLTGVLAAKSARMKCIAIPDDSSFSSPKFAIADVVLKSLLSLQEDVWIVLNLSRSWEWAEVLVCY